MKELQQQARSLRGLKKESRSGSVKALFTQCHVVAEFSIALAAAATIAAIVNAVITDALKSGLKALGNGLKEIGEKLASFLPDMIGAIVSFLFKTAGQVVGFLAEHTWLLILAVVAFLIEGYTKKRR